MDYTAVKQRLAHGWNTWNSRSVLSHVWLPSGFAVSLGIKEYARGQFLAESLIGRQSAHEEQIIPGPRTYDDRYTSLEIAWAEIRVRVQSALDGEDLLLLVTPLTQHTRTPVLTVDAAVLWNKDGSVRREGDTLQGDCPAGKIRVFVTKTPVSEPYVALKTPYLAQKLDSPVGISTGRARTVEEITAIITTRQVEYAEELARWGELAEVYTAVQTCMAWDTVYDPLFDRVMSTVSRLWNNNWGGYVLFCWDTYFAGAMAAIDNRDLAYANVIEITREITESGFVPNFASATGTKSRDRSQPPVGAAIIYQLYQQYGDRWLLEETFEPLLRWNRWWITHRATPDTGLLAWGSDPFTQVTGHHAEREGVNERFGAALESGLDNSPMYDEIPFDSDRHQLLLADAGLNGLYAMDCLALAKIADVLERSSEATELHARYEEYREKLQLLWDEEMGIFLNRRTDTGAFSHRLSPTNFYPLLASAAAQAQAERMIGEHFYNPNEFWGEWILPSIARNDPAYPEQEYWRGRIWAPMNYLVYLGLCNYDLPQARHELAERSRELLLKEWRAHGHVHENYSADSGEGCDKMSSDRFYHWGGLLGLIALQEDKESR